MKMRKRVFVLMCLMIFILSMSTMAFADPKTETTDTTTTNNGDVGELLDDISDGTLTSTQSGLDTFIGRYKGVIVTFTTIGALSMVLLFVINFIKLGASAGDPKARQSAITALVFTAIAAAGLGSVSIWVSIAYNFFKEGIA